MELYTSSNTSTQDSANIEAQRSINSNRRFEFLKDQGFYENVETLDEASPNTFRLMLIATAIIKAGQCEASESEIAKEIIHNIAEGFREEVGKCEPLETIGVHLINSTVRDHVKPGKSQIVTEGIYQMSRAFVEKCELLKMTESAWNLICNRLYTLVETMDAIFTDAGVAMQFPNEHEDKITKAYDFFTIIYPFLRKACAEEYQLNSSEITTVLNQVTAILYSSTLTQLDSAAAATLVESFTELINRYVNQLHTYSFLQNKN